MPIIEGIRIQNYRALKDVTFGRLWNDRNRPALTPFVAVIGKNGSGKSTLFDAFGFLADCLIQGVEEACDRRGRGGFSRLVTAGSSGPIRLELYFRESPDERPITYELSIGLDNDERPTVIRERLRQRRKNQKTGQPCSFLNLEHGEGDVWGGEEGVEGEDAEKRHVQLRDTRRLGIATLGELKEHPRISRFMEFLRGWYLSYFTSDAARTLAEAGPQKHLAQHGENLSNVVQYMERHHRNRFEKILARIAQKLPGIRDIKTSRTEDGRLLLKFYEHKRKKPLLAQQMSDGTLKLFSYLLLLEDPEPAPFICIEEPENGLYHKLLEELAHELRSHATGRKHAPQVFVTTHQPYLVDALKPEETWILERDSAGGARIRRAADDPIVQSMVEEGLPLGSLWYSDYLDPR